MNKPPPYAAVFIGLALCAVLVVALALVAGSVPLSPGAIWRGLLHDDATLAHTLVTELRLPRALTAFALGGLLALAGIQMQVLLRNPLADPYVLGTSGGAAVGALLALLLGASGWLVQGAAALGAFGAIFLVFAFAHAEGTWAPARLLLCGVVLAAGASAVITLLLALGDDSRLRGMMFWLMGDISGQSQPATLWLTLLAGTVVSLLLARHLNVLSRGEVVAHTLGMNVKRTRIFLFMLSALLTAAAVTTAGTVGFVGLVVPHLARQLTGADHRKLIPVAVIGGGTLLTLADTASRTLFAPRQLPVGALTALIGVPLFLALMFQRRR